MLLSVDIPTYPNTTLTMMTQDRATHGVTTPSSPNNLNPTAPVFQHSPNSPTGEKPPSDNIYSGTEAGRLGLLTNGDINTSGANYLLHLGGNGAGMLRETSPHSQMRLQNSMPIGLALSPLTMLATSTTINHQSSVTAVTSHQQQAAYAMSVLDKVGGQLVQKQAQASSNQSSAHISNGDAYETTSNASVGDDETSRNAESGGVGGGQDYPEEVLAPIRKQMQFYFSNENLPNDKFLNQHMDLDKYIPLELFLDFGRIKPICSSIDQLTKAVESSSILELSEDRKRVRVSQCRKTLTLRGFPQYTTEQDVHQFILETGAYVPTHIEFVMCKDNYSVWYVSFKDETAALNSFKQFHNQKAVYKGHTIGCCIKSSGTLVAAGYFPSSEESNQRRLAYQNQVAAVTATAPVHTVQNPLPQPQPQQPQALMQPFSAMQLHSYLSGSPTNIYYQQTPQGSYMPYMAGMLHGWPGATATMEPGLIMQNSGLQPQHIRSSMPRAHILPTGSATQHRFNRPQRPRQNHLERSASERPSDRPPVVSVSMPSRTSPHGESSTSITAVSQGAYMQRRATVQEDITPAVIPQPQLVSHQFVPSLVAQHQQHAVTTAAAINPSVLESIQHYQPPPHQHHHNHQQQQHSVMVQAAMANTASAPPPPMPQITNNPPPSTQHMHHQHIQPPPPVQHQTAAQHHHQQQQQQQQQTTHLGQHNSQHHQLNQQPPTLQLHHHQLPQSNQHQPQQSQLNHHHNHHQPSQQNHQTQQSSHQHQAPQSSHQHQAPQPSHQHQHQASQSSHHQRHHSPHQQHMVSSYHHHHSQQQHHQYFSPQVYHHHHQHQQSPPGNRSEKRSRRKREDNGKNQRLERSQSNRSNYNSQTLTAADNFTMEANSFPPLPGALNSVTNSEVSHESRMSDVVRGVSRNPGLGNPRASSSTPSPVATPAPGSVSGLHHGLSGSGSLDSHSVDNGDLALDDDVTSSSQEEVDTDINTFDSRSIRSEQPHSSAAESSVLPLHSSARSQRVSNAPLESSPAAVLAQRQGEHHQSSLGGQAEGKGYHRAAYSHQQTSPTAHSAVETPKLSYAQILAQKNREDANNAGGGENPVSGGLLPNPNSGTSNGTNLSQNINSAGPVGGNQTSIQTTNAFREHGNYQGGQFQGPHSSHRGQSKDGMSRSDGPPQSSRQPNGSRRNSKENRTSNKFDKRKPDARQK